MPQINADFYSTIYKNDLRKSAASAGDKIIVARKSSASTYEAASSIYAHRIQLNSIA
jgi:hypothetical protein